ncbi:hypothetical protein [uncultured Methanobrevibacter sp.]|uniref:hypothetical protein n=1 Tax=uncultured Methanobrevibacter sp. TaxID=253161 RepID=UPI0025FD2408|nr:hypothetical protein [uncultured Methanobrevibacter sp.]
MILSRLTKKSLKIGKVVYEYGNERIKQFDDDEFKTLTKELGKKYAVIADDKANQFMDETLDKANSKLEEVKNGEDSFSKGKEYVKDQLKNAIDYADENFPESPQEEDVELSLRKKQKIERDELISKHKAEILELQRKQSQEQKEALKIKIEKLKVKREAAEEILKAKKDEYIEEARNTKNNVKETVKIVYKDISEMKEENKSNDDSIDVDYEVNDKKDVNTKDNKQKK